MHSSYLLFKKNIDETKRLSDVYEYLNSNISVPLAFEDILRSQVVYAVSAFDKLIHDLVRVGIVDIFNGKRTPTGKYLSEPISIDLHQQLINADIPPKEHIFEQAIFKKFKTVSYQEPSKVSDGLSYIWNEKQKWQKIAEYMSENDKSVKTQLKLIASRRNTIVHEADIDPSTGEKYAITSQESSGIIDFLERCGEAIYSLVVTES